MIERGQHLRLRVCAPARAAGKSLNKRRDLADVAGSWRADRAIAEALAAQDQVDEDVWR